MREQIKVVFKEVFQTNTIKDDASRKTLDKWDSLNHLNLIVALETEFDVSFEPEEIITMNSLDVIEQIIRSKSGQ